VRVVRLPDEEIRIYHYEVYAVAFSANGTLLATAGDDGSVRVVRLPDDEEIRVFHDDEVYATAFSPDGTLLATASNDHSARVTHLPDGHEITRITHNGAAYAVAFSPLCCVRGEQGQAGWVDASSLSSSASSVVQLRGVSLPTGCDHAGGSLVPPLRALLP
jgi:WD40 repeat protein